VFLEVGDLVRAVSAEALAGKSEQLRIGTLLPIEWRWLADRFCGTALLLI
jgi:hypothetical protein